VDWCLVLKTLLAPGLPWAAIALPNKKAESVPKSEPPDSACLEKGVNG
jgi:hypothetical protein